MKTRHWLQMLLGGVVLSALLAMPGLPLPGADRLGLSGSAMAQQTIDIDTFYDELGDYGQWVWHPRFGYVWLPEDVSPNWRPYTVGHWVSTEEYGWYWESNEPFAWAIYHYGRWGYDPDYGWFWVPGDTWAPAWVQWRYDDQYVGWAPIGPRRSGYAYGVPVSYEPPIAESWVFVQPRYMTSRAIRHYAVPIADLGVVFLGATNVYRPQFRGGIVYNYGIPRDRLVRITKRPIYVKKIYKVDNWKGGRFDKDRRKNGIKVYAPGVHKNGKPHRGPKKFVDDPNQFKPKTKLKHTFKGEPPKGFGRGAKDVKSIAKENPDAFKKKHGKFGGPGGDRDNKDFKDFKQGKDGKNGRDGKDQKAKGGPDDKDFKNLKQVKPGRDGRDDKAKGGPDNKDFKDFKDLKQGKKGKDGKDQKAKGGPDNQDAKQGQGGPPSPPKNLTVDGKKNGDKGAPNGKPQTVTPPPIQKSINKDKDQDGRGGKDSKQGKGDNDRDGNKNKNKQKDFGGQGGPNQAKTFDQNGGQGGGNKNKNKDRDKGERGGNKNQQFSRPDGDRQNQGGGGGGGGGGDNGNKNKNKNKKDKCQKHPEKPECQ